jgi:hypothetical protein
VVVDPFAGLPAPRDDVRHLGWTGRTTSSIGGEADDLLDANESTWPFAAFGSGENVKNLLVNRLSDVGELSEPMELLRTDRVRESSSGLG